MTNAKRVVAVAAGLLLGTLAIAAVSAPANARWGSDGRWYDDNGWHQDNRWVGRDRNENRYYDGYQYRPPPVIYGTPQNYNYNPPPVYYDNRPGFSIRIN
jgi:hypothetical protein